MYQHVANAVMVKKLLHAGIASYRVPARAGLMRFKEAAMTLDEGLRLDPLSSSMQQLHAEASRGMLGDLLEGTHLTVFVLQDATSLIDMCTRLVIQKG